MYSATRSVKTRVAAFTLIELLVVIAIISILAAILFPVFASAREKARQTTCASNEKQIAMGVLQYNQDYDEMMLQKVGGCQGWFWPMYSYIKSTDVLECPDDPTKQPGGGTYVSSYAYNSDLYNGGSNTPINISKLTAPTQTVLLTEATYAAMRLNAADQSAATEGFAYDCGAVLHTGYMGGRSSGYNANLVNTALGFQPTGWHSGGANFAAVDGHVKWLTGDMVSNGATQAINTYEAQNNINYAAGTGSMTDAAGRNFVMTYSYL